MKGCLITFGVLLFAVMFFLIVVGNMLADAQIAEVGADGLAQALGYTSGLVS